MVPEMSAVTALKNCFCNQQMMEVFISTVLTIQTKNFVKLSALKIFPKSSALENRKTFSLKKEELPGSFSLWLDTAAGRLQIRSLVRIPIDLLILWLLCIDKKRRISILKNGLVLWNRVCC
jgi:hypothetical protein